MYNIEQKNSTKETHSNKGAETLTLSWGRGRQWLAIDNPAEAPNNESVMDWVVSPQSAYVKVLSQPLRR